MTGAPALSVIVPVYNESPTIEEALRRVEKVTIKSNHFDFEPKITAKVAKKGYRVYETPISYSGRSYEEVRIPVKPAAESGGNRPGRSEATLEVNNHLRSGRFESIRMTLFG